ncbi:26236_t:CDS:2 [Gigaspora margarita]|uniref:26236_t:CDS:1 n=1 Tax=Gigaspora margarita TaxID=4874 RepID=A0ABM8VVB6_GIGMA|nr:26236_t:CDS:2 [Gigaspora margarita]
MIEKMKLLIRPIIVASSLKVGMGKIRQMRKELYQEILTKFTIDIKNLMLRMLDLLMTIIETENINPLNKNKYDAYHISFILGSANKILDTHTLGITNHEYAVLRNKKFNPFETTREQALQQTQEQQTSNRKYDSELPSQSNNNDNAPTSGSPPPDNEKEENSSPTSEEKPKVPISTDIEKIIEKMERIFQEYKEEVDKLSDKEKKSQLEGVPEKEIEAIISKIECSSIKAASQSLKQVIEEFRQQFQTKKMQTTEENIPL